MPKKVTKGASSLEYVYEAAGNKLYGDGKYYEGNVVYDSEKNPLYMVWQEGKIEFVSNKQPYRFNYLYDITDHLGSVRSVVNKGFTNAVQTNDYYPFGLTHATVPTSQKLKYLYNGKELQSFGDLDYGARRYDPVLGIWRTIDPLAEQSRRFSPYAYCYNNPLRFIDLDGRLAGDYYNIQGSFLFNDGIDDNKKWIVLNDNEAKNVKKTGTASLKSAIENPSEAIMEMADQVSAITDKENKEYGFVAAADGTTSSMIVGTDGSV